MLLGAFAHGPSKGKVAPIRQPHCINHCRFRLSRKVHQPIFLGLLVTTVVTFVPEASCTRPPPTEYFIFVPPVKSHFGLSSLDRLSCQCEALA